jgi:hypothetical protein
MEQFWQGLFGSSWEIAEIQMFGPIAVIICLFGVAMLASALIQGGVNGVKKALGK